MGCCPPRARAPREPGAAVPWAEQQYGEGRGVDGRDARTGERQGGEARSCGHRRMCDEHRARQARVHSCRAPRRRPWLLQPRATTPSVSGRPTRRPRARNWRRPRRAARERSLLARKPARGCRQPRFSRGSRRAARERLCRDGLASRNRLVTSIRGPVRGKSNAQSLVDRHPRCHLNRSPASLEAVSASSRESRACKKGSHVSVDVGPRCP